MLLDAKPFGGCSDCVIVPVPLHVHVAAASVRLPSALHPLPPCRHAARLWEDGPHGFRHVHVHEAALTSGAHSSMVAVCFRGAEGEQVVTLDTQFQSVSRRDWRGIRERREGHHRQSTLTFALPEQASSPGGRVDGRHQSWVAINPQRELVAAKVGREQAGYLFRVDLCVGAVTRHRDGGLHPRIEVILGSHIWTTRSVKHPNKKVVFIARTKVHRVGTIGSVLSSTSMGFGVFRHHEGDRTCLVRHSPTRTI